MPAAFITGSGTDIGKTFVAAGLIRQYRLQGRSVDAIKPVVSGYEPARAEESDPGRLLAALGRPLTPDEIARVSPFRFRAPLAPDMAAQREGRAVDFGAVVETCRHAMAAAEVLLVEGVGGVMAPLDGRHTVLDWASVLRMPMVLVGGSYLGSISHTLTALHVVAQRGLDIAAIVISESASGAVPLAATAAEIARFAAPVEVLALPRLAAGGEAHQAFARLAALVG